MPYERPQFFAFSFLLFALSLSSTITILYSPIEVFTLVTLLPQPFLPLISFSFYLLVTFSFLCFSPHSFSSSTFYFYFYFYSSFLPHFHTDHRLTYGSQSIERQQDVLKVCFNEQRLIYTLKRIFEYIRHNSYGLLQWVRWRKYRWFTHSLKLHASDLFSLLHTFSIALSLFLFHLLKTFLAFLVHL